MLAQGYPYAPSKSVFSNTGRIGNDKTSISQQNIQDNAFANYMLQNPYLKDSTMKKPIEFATNQLNINYSAPGGKGHQVGLGGHNIDDNSKVVLGALNTNPNCKLSLVQRPFLTVPFLGRGASNAVLESQLQQGDSVTNRKTITGLSEVSYASRSNYPLLPSIQGAINNSKYLVESDASSDWMRGGVPTRELAKQNTNLNMN